jgi:hypothetical protein
MLGDFSSVVMRHRLAHLRRKCTEGVAACTHHFVRGFVGNKDGPEVETGALCEGRYSTLSIPAADHKIALPVAASSLYIHNLRTLFDALAVGDPRSFLGYATPFVLLALITETSKQVATFFFVAFDVGVNALMADRVLPLSFSKTPGNLIGTLTIMQL